MRRLLCAALLVAVSTPACADPRADLKSPQATVRIQAARALGRAADRAAVPELIEALSDQNAAVRREAAAALGAIKDRRAAGALVKALGDADVNVRFQAAYALGEIKAPAAAEALLAALGDPEWCVRDQAAWALRELRDPDLAAGLAERLKKPGADGAHVVWLLRQVAGDRAIPSLAELLSDANPETRKTAVQTLVEINKPEVVQPLIGALADASPAVRRIACEGLGSLAPDEAEKPLEGLIAREQDQAVREAAERALARLGHRSALMGHWPFDEGDAKVARDATGHGNDGQIRGCEAAEGKVGRALRFGPGQYVELGKPPALPIAGRPFTVTAWCKPEADTGVLVGRGGAFCGFSLYLQEGRPKFGIRRSRDVQAEIAAAKEKVALDQWVHLAGVVRDDRLELYVNGRLAATAKAGLMPGNCGQGMEIGFDAGNSAAEITDAFEGVIDEVKMYGAALGEKDLARECE